MSCIAVLVYNYCFYCFQDGQYFLAKEGFRNNQLEELLRFYYEEELPTVQVKLTWPYKLHDKFKKLNI